MTDVNPLAYRLRLEPDLETFGFEGLAEIDFEAPAPVAEIVLNALELAVWHCRLTADGAPPRPCAFELDPAREQLRVRLPEPATGAIRLEIAYRGRINDRMAGFYRSAYRDGEQTRYIAVTQFEESDARRAFPCMDHPARKATFDIEMRVAPGLTAVANTAPAAVEQLADGRTRVVFARTPKMSTYLVFFGVGDFTVEQNDADPRVRTVTLPGRAPNARWSMDFARKALAYCEDYYGIAYPLSKLDLIAVPDFAFGAMENWGAITFRENLLLVYPQVTSAAGRERICEVIAHELAHQWFGNLVTPADWSYLWLNESFATYFGFGVVAHHEPQWQSWQQFLLGMTATALDRDALVENTPIEIPGGEHLVINTATAPIIYNKGGSILRQVAAYVGPDKFREGLRRYLKTHAYGCAASHHLWEALEAVSEKPVAAMMRSWIEQPGHPLITAARRDGYLVLDQRRFTYLPAESDQLWQVPVAVEWFDETGAGHRQTVLLDAARREVPLPAGTRAYKVNCDQGGFFRVRYDDPQNLDRLGELAEAGALSVEDRWGLQNDLFALLKAGALELADYLGFLVRYRREEAYLPLASIAANLAEAHLAAGPGGRRRIAALAGPWFGEVLARLPLAPQPEEPHTTALLRDQLIWEAAVYGEQAAVAFAAERFEALKRGQPVHPDILRSVATVAARSGDHDTFDWLVGRLGEAEAEHERHILLAALGCFQDQTVLERTLAYVLSEVPARNKFIPVAAMGANPVGGPLLWAWFTRHLETIEGFHPMIFERVIAAVVPAAGLDQPQAVRAFVTDYSARTGRAADVIRLSLEKMEIGCRLRARTP